MMRTFYPGAYRSRGELGYGAYQYPIYMEQLRENEIARENSLYSLLRADRMKELQDSRTFALRQQAEEIGYKERAQAIELAHSAAMERARLASQQATAVFNAMSEAQARGDQLYYNQLSAQNAAAVRSHELAQQHLWEVQKQKEELDQKWYGKLFDAAVKMDDDASLYNSLNPTAQGGEKLPEGMTPIATPAGSEQQYEYRVPLRRLGSSSEPTYRSDGERRYKQAVGQLQELRRQYRLNPGVSGMTPIMPTSQPVAAPVKKANPFGSSSENLY